MSRQSNSRYLTEEEYLRAEETAKLRHEYVDGHVFAMTGASEAHNLICSNLLAAIHNQLQGGQCRAYASDMKVRIESAKSYYYPDIVVTCEPFDAKSMFKLAPVILIEVLSPSTFAIDRREKLVAYKKIESLKEYVLVYQDRQKLELIRRVSNNEWSELTILAGEKLVLEALVGEPISISLETIYRGYDPPSRVREDEATYRI